MSYRASTDSYLTCPHCGAEVADRALFCAACGTPLRASATSEQRGHASRRMAAAVIAGAILAVIGAGVVGALLAGWRPGTVASEPSPSEGETASVEATPSSAPQSSASTASATPTASPSASARAVIDAPTGILPPGSIAQVTADGLRVRAGGPNDAAHDQVIATINAGTMVLIGETPFSYVPPEASGDGRGWYEVHVGGRDMTSHIDGGTNGWVVEGENGLEHLVLEEPVCAGPPMTLESLVTYEKAEGSPLVTAWDRLACAGGQQLELEGVFDFTCNEVDTSPHEFDPDFLASPTSCFGGLWVDDIDPEGYFRSGALPLRLPDSETAPAERGDVARVVGHFDDPASSECTAQIPAPVDSQDIDPEFLVLFCREQFVVEEFSVIDHRELAPQP